MVMLMIDIQRGIVNDRLYAFERFTETVKTLLTAARKNGVEVIHVRHDDGEGAVLTRGRDEFEIHPDFAPEDGELVFDKRVNSPFRDTGLLEYLRKNPENKLMVVGLQTDYCIDATVKCGFEHGFEMVIPQYGNTTVDNEYMSGEMSYNYHNTFIWNDRYGKSVSLDEALILISNRTVDKSDGYNSISLRQITLPGDSPPAVIFLDK